MKNVSLEVVREKLLEYVHQEIPYGVEHRLTDWKELRDGSLRIEQHLITPKMSQRKILVGKNGSKIGRIGVEANEELRSIFKRNVHLILQPIGYIWRGWSVESVPFLAFQRAHGAETLCFNVHFPFMRNSGAQPLRDNCSFAFCSLRFLERRKHGWR
ncbi:unnamed protein product [Ilex paraguariensis]|uniref:KH type-2 domain-containing protein n=1 Tax=Ilex paraguariensis TaxID=185542 RepID=A0ABC8TK83_9AQUA